jgi:peptidoglycan/xylan/chitin deacetylase (PgdA/CDA1 family)
MVKSLRQFVPIFASSAAFGKVVALLDQTGGERPNLLRVLTYHRVDAPQARPWLDPVLISASPEVFEVQMKYISANYQPISVFDVLEALEKDDRMILPRRAVLVTFDDAYQDFEQHAWPVLKRYRIPVTLFVPTAFPDHPERLFWWDRLFHALHSTVKNEIITPIGTLAIGTDMERSQANLRLKNHIKSLPNNLAIAFVEDVEGQLDIAPQANCVLSWKELRKLAQEGVTLGPHTQTHPIMNHIPPSAMQNEALDSLYDLQREIGETPPVFAYPSGFHNTEVVNAVRAAGFKLAFTTERGINILGRDDPLQLQRINVGAQTTVPILQAQLLSLSASLYPIGKKVLTVFG